jgi:hypothetical protein
MTSPKGPRENAEPTAPPQATSTPACDLLFFFHFAGKCPTGEIRGSPATAAIPNGI